VRVMCCRDLHFDHDAGGTVSWTQPRRYLLLLLSTPLTVSYTSPFSVHGYSVWLHHYYCSICATGGILSNSKIEPAGPLHSDLTFLTVRYDNLTIQNVFSVLNCLTFPNWPIKKARYHSRASTRNIVLGHIALLGPETV
jgi:hypothetical protein